MLPLHEAMEKQGTEEGEDVPGHPRGRPESLRAKASKPGLTPIRIIAEAIHEWSRQNVPHLRWNTENLFLFIVMVLIKVLQER